MTEKQRAKASSILILSDHEAQRASFARLAGTLSSCSPVPFERVEDALMWAIPGQPVLIVLIDMRPGHVGLEFLRRAQSVPELAQIPKYFVCGSDSEVRHRALSFGATTVGGGSDPHELTEQMQSLVTMSHVRTTLAAEIRRSAELLAEAETRSTRYLRRLEMLYKAAVEGELSDDERITALLLAGAQALRPGGRFFGMLSRVTPDYIEGLAIAEADFDKSVVSKMAKIGERVPTADSLVAAMVAKDDVAVWNDLWADPNTVSLTRVRELGLRAAIGMPLEVERDQFCIWFASRLAMVESPFGEEDETFVELVTSIVTMILRERKRTAQLRWQAERDDLTGLANRATFSRALQKAAETGKGRKFAVLQFDLDNFQVINDTLGHPVGDAVLVAIAQRLQRAVRKGEIVSRLGGDEFAMSLGIESPDAASERAKELLSLFESPVSAAGMQLQVGTTIGGAIFPDHTDKPDELLPRADAALYEGKRMERGSFRLFDPAITQRLEKRRSLQGELRDALANNQFVLYFQPEVDLKTGAIVGAESLIRWRHPERGIVSPGEFIPYAEESTLIRRIGAWTVEKACETVAQLVKEMETFRLYVNLSAGQLSDPALLEYLVDVVTDRNVRSDNLGFEITESLAMRDPKLTLNTVGGLRERGFKIAIDDFGTGYSSLAYLSHLDPDVIKIDKAFVDGVPTSRNDQAIIETVVHFAQKTDRLVLAEGIEQLKQMAWLYRSGVNIAQGYHVGRPMPVNEFVMWARRWKTAHQAGKVRPWHQEVALS